MVEKLFYFLAFLTLFSGAMVVFSKNPVHSVLYLILVFYSLSAHYILLNAQFLAAVNIIVYAGAIMVLFLFVIMFLNLKTEAGEQRSILAKLSATVAGGLLLTILTAAFRQTESLMSVSSAASADTGLIQTLGKVLYRDFYLPFELASVLFLVAMVGAVMLGKREPGEKNSF